LTAEDIANGAPVAPRFVAPAPGYAVDPGVLGWLLVAVAVAAILGAGVLIAAARRASRRRERRLQLPPISARSTARWRSRATPRDGRRRRGREALERLAGELGEAA
jgi:hypothetical protein